MRVYLGGPINGCSDEEASGWRDEAKATLTELGHTAVDPMDRDYRGREMEPGIAKIIVEQDKQDILSSDVVLVATTKPSWGTAWEMSFAYDRGIPIVLVHPPGNLSPWLVYHVEAIVHTLEDGIAEAVGTE